MLSTHRPGRPRPVGDAAPPRRAQDLLGRRGRCAAPPAGIDQVRAGKGPGRPGQGRRQREDAVRPSRQAGPTIRMPSARRPITSRCGSWDSACPGWRWSRSRGAYPSVAGTYGRDRASDPGPMASTVAGKRTTWATAGGAGSRGVICPGNCMHARSLTIEHPVTKKQITFTAPLPSIWPGPGSFWTGRKTTFRPTRSR